MIPLLFLTMGCEGPQLSDAFHQVNVTTVSSDAEVVNAFVEAIDGASARVSVLVPGLESDALAQAIINAQARGVDVTVATDVDARGQSGLSLLESASVPIRYANDAVSYFDFAINSSVFWTSEQVVMTHTMVVVDEIQVVNASHLGAGEGSRFIWTARGEDIAEDMDIEQNQIFGGSDASSRTAFDSLAKSVADLRWMYPTQTDHNLEIWLGPQERLVKRVIDHTYGARANIWVMTNDLADEGLIRALYAKRRDGFDVRVIVGPDFGRTSPNSSALLLRETPGLDKRQLTDAVVPTLIIIDTMRDSLGRYNVARGMNVSHDLWSANRLFAGSEVLTDQLVDGSMWTLTDVTEPSGELLNMQQVFEDAWDRATPLLEE
ncbi:MAG: hypothetical protein AAFV53_23720 [Myxococcota bacterium]